MVLIRNLGEFETSGLQIFPTVFQHGEEDRAVGHPHGEHGRHGFRIHYHEESQEYNVEAALSQVRSRGAAARSVQGAHLLLLASSRP